MFALMAFNVMLSLAMLAEAMIVSKDEAEAVSWECLRGTNKIVIGVTILILEFFYISLVFISMKIMCRVGYLLKTHIPAAFKLRWAKIRLFIICILTFQIIRCVLNILMQFRSRYANFSRLGIYIVDVF